ncbi:DUF6663 family protein [Halomarina ordinaria]|uniref:DUF6663 family protein n=1 Tax=Halomarina ordinaria TaxID=3033939 RepID=A0ABD5UEG9_9EURY|nr:DUF6663 family protein [Halomarina sp. PSRA2]
MSDSAVYRVLRSTRADDEFLLLDTETADPVYVERAGYDDPLADRVAALEPGNTVRATFDWDGERPRFVALDRLTETHFSFARDVSPTFQAALDCWAEADRAGEAMNAHLTRNTDGDVNGVLYVFAEQAGERDLFAEFEDGLRPLDPLVARIEGADPPYDVFVLDPAADPFVVVYIALRRDGLLAETVRDTYSLDS